MQTDSFISFGGEVKALAEEDGRMKVGGYVVLFGSPETPDLSPHRDYFTKATDFGFDVASKGRVRWHHGLDPAVGRDVLGLVDLKTEPDDVGVWAEGWISQRTAYEKKVGEWVRQHRAGWSTGVPAHCVGRKAVGDAHEITEWPLGADVSITLTPADPRQAAGVLSLKSLLPDAPADDAAAGADHESPGGSEAVAAKALTDRSARLVADCEELAGLYAKARDQREAEGRHLSREKRDAIKALSERLAALASVPGAKADPDTVRRLRLALLRDRV